VLFAVRGLAGLYKGRYSTDPYYLKIQKYNNMESRDLWEYSLSLNEDQIDTLIRHLWEIGPYGSPYYFFNRNCSYQLLPLLEVARPELELSSPFVFRAIPLDTLKIVVKNESLEESIHERPSQIRVLMARRKLMGRTEVRLAKNLSKNPSDKINLDLKSLPQDRQLLILDTALDFWRIKAGYERDLPEEKRTIERKLLLARNEIKKHPPILNISPGIPPHEAHGTLHSAIAYGSGKTEPFMDLSIRPALHDLNSSPHGFIKGSELEMFHTRLRYNSNLGKFYLDELRLINILSLSPWDSFTPVPSWGVQAALLTPKDFVEERRISPTLKGGSGTTVILPFFEDCYVYTLAMGEAASGTMYRDGYRLGAGAKVGSWIQWTKTSRLHASATVLRFFAGNPGDRVQWEAVQTFDIINGWECRFQTLRDNGTTEGKIALVLNR
jgi:hypothetical protein